MTATSAPRNSWAPGDVIAGRYRVTHIVGRGAMGAVYGAEHIETGQGVAVKCMLISEAEGDQFVRRFSQEARVMASLRSPNTIRIYDFGRDSGGALYMAMELLEGVPLDKRIRDLQRQGKALGERETLEIGIQILRSLGEAHGKGLVHRDMKPGNVFLTDDGSGEVLTKVLDFGIARVADSSLTNAGNILGTPTYMSPEQWDGGELDARADLYAVGCILFCCATGQPPYRSGDNVLSLMKKHCFSPIPDVRELATEPLSEGFAHVVQIALAKERADRFADARTMREALQAVLGGAWAGTPLAIERMERAGRFELGDAEAGPTVKSRVPTATAADRKHQANAAARESGTMSVTDADIVEITDEPEAPAGALRMVVRGGVVGAIAAAAAIVGWLALRPDPPPAVAVPVQAAAPVAATPVAAPKPPTPVVAAPASPAPFQAVVPMPAVAPEAVAADPGLGRQGAPTVPHQEAAVPPGPAVAVAPAAEAGPVTAAKAPEKAPVRRANSTKPPKKRPDAPTYNTVD